MKVQKKSAATLVLLAPFAVLCMSNLVSADPPKQGPVNVNGKVYKDAKGTLVAVMKDPVKAPLFDHLKDGNDHVPGRYDVWARYQSDNGPVKAGPLTRDKPTSRTVRKLEGWTVRVDDRLLQAPNDVVGARAIRFLKAKLADIKAVVPEERLKKLQSFTIVLDWSHGKLRAMQYHPSAGWLKANGYSTDLAKCVHIPRAADLPTRRNINEQPWVILHELAHAYHDQVLGFEEPRIREAYEKFKKSGHGDKVLLYNGKRVRHYALTNPMEFFAEMTEAYFGVNDYFPFNRAELREAEPGIFALLSDIWEPSSKRKP